MSTIVSPPDGWEQVERPPSLFRRYQFSSYRDTRAFLDRLAVLSAETDLYPDLGFGTTYVNVTIHHHGDGPALAQVEFANRAAALARAVAATV
jgi:pterin-4a-carbinolamine dehydratase